MKEPIERLTDEAALDLAWRAYDGRGVDGLPTESPNPEYLDAWGKSFLGVRAVLAVRVWELRNTIRFELPRCCAWLVPEGKNGRHLRRILTQNGRGES